MNELVSIIIPVYNAEKYLMQCLDSIVNQTYRNLEIICVNDGSNDCSLDICKKYADKDNRVRVIDQENKGHPKTRNETIWKISGDYVYYMDADDWLELNAIERMVRAAMDNHTKTVLFPYIREYGSASLKKQVFAEPVKFFDKIGCRNLLRRLIGPYTDEELAHPESNDAICTMWAKLYDPEIIRKYRVEYPDNSVVGSYGDGVFNMNYFLHVENAVYINEYLYHYRKTNESSIVTQHRSNFIPRWEKLFSIIREFVAENDLGSDCEKARENRIAFGIIGFGFNAVVHPDGFGAFLKELRQARECQGMDEALRGLKTDSMKLHWRVFFGCAKHKFIFLLAIMIKTMFFLKQRI